MTTPVSSLRNLGPAVEQACARAGISSAEELRDLGADQAYRRLIAAGTRPHFIGYYALVMTLQGRPWTDCHGAEKAALRRAFDHLKSDISAPSGGAAPDDAPDRVQDGALDRALDEIGVIPRRPTR